MSESALPSTSLLVHRDFDVGHFFLPFHTLVKGAVVALYNGLGLDNLHLTCTILDANSAKIKSLLSKNWQSTVA